MWNAVGVPEEEGRVYEALLRHHHADVTSLAAELTLSRGSTTRALTDLANHGLVTRLPGRPARFSAVAPDHVAASLIADRERELLQLRTHTHQLGELHRLAHTSEQHPADLVGVVQGQANVRNTFTRIQREARHQFRSFDRPPYLNDPVKGNPEEERQLEGGGIAYRVIYDHSALAIPGRMADVWDSIHRGEQARVASVPMKMALADDTAALIPANAGSVLDAAYLVHPSSLLDAVSALFETTWARAVPLNRAPAHQATEQGLLEEDVDMLGLLAGGNTDEAIARSLGWNVRTVRRHVHRIMVEVGAQTRLR